MNTVAAQSLHAELVKAVTLRSMWVIGVLGIGAVAMVSAYGVAQISSMINQGRAYEVGISLVDWPLLVLETAQVIPVLLGAWVFGLDVGPSRRTAALSVPRRGVLAATKLVTVVVCVSVAWAGSVAAAFTPLAMSDRAAVSEAYVALPWSAASWVTVGVTAGAMVAVTRSVAVAATALLVWVHGLSGMVAQQIPATKHVADRVFRQAIESGSSPSGTDVIWVCVQVAICITIGVAVFMRRDIQ